MLGTDQQPYDGLCLACREREATPESFLCLVCLPEPEPAPEPEVWQPGLFEVLAA